MIAGNRICFGFGDIAVRSYAYHLSFQQLKSPTEIGAVLNERKDIEFIGDEIRLDMSYDDCATLYLMLNEVDSGSSRVVELKGYLLDFSNYDASSVAVIKRHILRLVVTNFHWT